MPRDNKLTGVPATPVTSKPEKLLTESKPSTATVTAPPQTNTLAQAAKKVTLPAWLQKSQMPEVADSDLGGYVGFASEISAKWNEQQMAGLSNGDPYLYYQNRYILANPLEFFLLAGESFLTLMVGKKGEFKWASRDLDEEGPVIGTNKPEDHYVCLLVVKAEGRLIPIKGDFRGTKSGGISGAIRAVEAAGTPEWLQLSDAHKVTAAFPQPFGRVYHRTTTKPQVSKASGNPYFRASCVSNPATLTQMQELVDAMTDDDFLSELNECRKNFDARIAFFDAIIAGQTAKPTA